MFTLVTDHSKYIRVRRGADQGAVEKELKSPVDDVFAGEILLRAEGMEIYVAKPHDSYASVAYVQTVCAEHRNARKHIIY